MSEPLNPVGLSRLRAIVDLIEHTNDPRAELRVYVSDNYAAVEVRSHNLDRNALRLLFQAAPLESDELEALDEIARLAAERLRRS